METKIRDYVDDYNDPSEKPVEIQDTDPLSNGRPIIVAYNEGGYLYTKVDLIDVIQWVKENRPDLL